MRADLRKLSSQSSSTALSNRVGKERGGTCLALLGVISQFPSSGRTERLVSQSGVVTGGSEEGGDENHTNGKAFRDYESTDSPSADCPFPASGVCRNLRGGAVRRDTPAEPDPRQGHTRWIRGTRFLRPGIKKLRHGGCQARTLFHQSPLAGYRNRFVLHNPARQRGHTNFHWTWRPPQDKRYAVWLESACDYLGYRCDLPISWL